MKKRVLRKLLRLALAELDEHDREYHHVTQEGLTEGIKEVLSKDTLEGYVYANNPIFDMPFKKDDPAHLKSCGTKYRGCAPNCPVKRADEDFRARVFDEIDGMEVRAPESVKPLGWVSAVDFTQRIIRLRTA